MIKLILFDLGNVILPFDVMRLAERLSEFSPLSAPEIIGKLWNTQLADEFETGKMSPADYYELQSKQCQFTNLPFEKFIPIFNDIFSENPPVIEMIKKLKTNYTLGLISNTNEIHANHVKESYDCLASFEKHWFSNEAGVRKPNSLIYTMALDHFSRPPHETVFIDDTMENVMAASKMGIHSLHFKNHTKLEKELGHLGVKI